MRRADSRPMCIGRSMNLLPSLSARLRSDGPRSTVNTDSSTATTIATTTTMPIRMPWMTDRTRLR